MPELNREYNDREILGKIAEVEAERHPFSYQVAGVEWDEIAGDFTYNDFGNPPTIMVPNRMKQLERNGYLTQVYPNRSSANASYRLTEMGWSIVDVSEPEGPVEDISE